MWVIKKNSWISSFLCFCLTLICTKAFSVCFCLIKFDYRCTWLVFCNTEALCAVLALCVFAKFSQTVPPCLISAYDYTFPWRVFLKSRWSNTTLKPRGLRLFQVCQCSSYCIPNLGYMQFCYSIWRQFWQDETFKYLLTLGIISFVDLTFSFELCPLLEVAVACI